MKIEHIHIENYMGFKSVDLDLPVGPVFILGENRDQQTQASNGSGKSAFIEAITWCLFDSIRPDTLKNEVIHWGEEYALVALDIEHEGQQVRVCRTRNHPELGSGATLTVNGVDQTRHKEADTIKAIERHIGITAKAFFNSAMSTDPVVNPPFVSLTPAKMLAVVSEILDIDRFDTYSDRAKEWRKDCVSDYQDLQRSYESYKSTEEYIKTKIEEADASIQVFDLQQKAEVAALTARRQKHEATVAQLEVELDNFEGVADEYKSFDRSKINTRTKLMQKHAEQQALLDKLQEEMSEIKGRVGKERSKVESLQASYDNLAEAGECDYCGNEISNSKTALDKLTAFQNALETQTDKLTKYESKGIKLACRLQELRVELAETEQKLSESEEDVKRYSALKEQMDVYNELYAALELASGKVNGIQAQIDLVEKQTIQSVISAKEQLEADLVSNSHELSQVVDLLEEAQLELDALTMLVKIFKQIKVGVMNGFVAELVQQINYNLDQFTEGDFTAEVELKQSGLQLRFANSEKLGPRRYGALSGGEQVRVAKATQVAVMQVSGATTLIEDEGFSKLDPAGVSGIIDFMLESGMVNLLFVSHATVVSDYLKDYPTLKITKDGDVATAEIV
jgi:DNA repair protein SbcC/Rad50